MWRLNFCVRDGNRWNPPAIVTGNFYSVVSTLRSFRSPLTTDSLPFFALFASFAPRPAPSKPHRIDLESVFLQWLASFDQALDLLVSASYIRYRTSTADLSTSSSLRGLTYLCSGSLILQGGFTLRCLQRLSRPHFASLLCPWQNNSFTRGASIPVLSY